MTQLTKPTLEKQIDALVEMRERFLVMAITYKVGDQFDGDFQSIEDAIESLRELAALTAQQEPTEPVAWHVYKPTIKTDAFAQCTVYSLEEANKVAARYGATIRPLIYGDTAPPSGVRADSPADAVVVPMELLRQLRHYTECHRMVFKDCGAPTQSEVDAMLRAAQEGK